MANLPKHFTDFVAAHPEVGKAYGDLGKAVAGAGPLDARTQMLIKLGFAIAAGLEGGTHSAARKAVEAGATAEEVRHAAILGLTTVGFPTMMKGLAWVEDIVGAGKKP